MRSNYEPEYVPRYRRWQEVCPWPDLSQFARNSVELACSELQVAVNFWQISRTQAGSNYCRQRP
jgi:hypothetical protein